MINVPNLLANLSASLLPRPLKNGIALIKPLVELRNVDAMLSLPSSTVCDSE
jgi:hypothetical protein